MTKKELADVEALKTQLALHFYPFIEPDILPPENMSDGIKNGWLFNEYTKEVRKACTSCVSHSYGEWDKTTSQNTRRLYSTEKLAYQALLSCMADKYARELRDIERRMEGVQL